MTGFDETRAAAHPSPFVWRFLLPGLVMLVPALLGPLSPGTGMLALCSVLPLPVLLLWELVAGLRQFARGGPGWPAWLGTGLLLASLVVTSFNTMGAPPWMKERARPLQQALEEWRARHGHLPPMSSIESGFPGELAAPLNASRCFYYRPDGDHYFLTCPGVGFTKCSYDSRTDTWRGWD